MENPGMSMSEPMRTIPRGAAGGPSCRVVIVDGESASRNQLKRLLEIQHPDVEVVAEASDGEEAITVIERAVPDMLFLDVAMPGMDGFELLQSLDLPRAPQVVFVTAHEHFAARAFEVHAIDYILKPLDDERLAVALDRARTRLRSAAPAGRGPSPRLVPPNPDERHIERFLVKGKDRLFFVDTSDVELVEAAGNYVRVRIGTARYLIRQTLQRVEERLDPDSFCRIHRSVIVNLRKIRELYPMTHGNYTVVLESGREVTMTRGYRKHLEAHWSL